MRGFGYLACWQKACQGALELHVPFAGCVGGCGAQMRHRSLLESCICLQSLVSVRVAAGSCAHISLMAGQYRLSSWVGPAASNGRVSHVALFPPHSPSDSSFCGSRSPVHTNFKETAAWQRLTLDFHLPSSSGKRYVTSMLSKIL